MADIADKLLKRYYSVYTRLQDKSSSKKNKIFYKYFTAFGTNC